MVLVFGKNARWKTSRAFNIPDRWRRQPDAGTYILQVKEIEGGLVFPKYRVKREYMITYTNKIYIYTDTLQSIQEQLI